MLQQSPCLFARIVCVICGSLAIAKWIGSRSRKDDVGGTKKAERMRCAPAGTFSIRSPMHTLRSIGEANKNISERRLKKFKTSVYALEQRRCSECLWMPLNASESLSAESAVYAAHIPTYSLCNLWCTMYSLHCRLCIAESWFYRTQEENKNKS